MYNLITSAKDNDLSIGFDRDRGRRQRELSNNEIIKGKYHVRSMLKDVFGCAEHQEKATYGLAYKLTLTRNTDNSVLNKDNVINIGKVKINAIGWYVPHYTPSISNQAIFSKQILIKTTVEIQYVERGVFMKEVNLWTFELGTQEGIKVTLDYCRFSTKRWAIFTEFKRYVL